MALFRDRNANAIMTFVMTQIMGIITLLLLATAILQSNQYLAVSAIPVAMLTVGLMVSSAIAKLKP